MKYQELISTVARLGFETEIEDDVAFRGAVSRGLYTIFNDRPTLKHRTIIKRDYGNIPLCGLFTHDPRHPEVFALPDDGTAFSFKIYGDGYYTMSDGEVVTDVEISGEGDAVKAFYKKGARITFGGDTSYTVTSLSAFKNSFSNSISDIPVAADAGVIIISERIPDFLAPEDPPKDNRGGIIAGAEIEGDRLILPDDFVGEVHLTYRRKPAIPVGVSLNEDIDIPAECTELLPLIVASYIWLDDEPERAQYYLSLYKDGINGIRRFASRQVSPSYETNGWA